MSKESNRSFFQAIERVFKGWPALVMVVDNCFGGPNSVEKAEWMIEVTGEFMCETWPVSAEEVEEYVSTIMDQEFDTIMEDGSLAQVAKQLCDLKQLCAESSPKAVEDYLTSLPTPISLHKQSVQQCAIEADPIASGCVQSLQSLQLENEGGCEDSEKDSSSVMEEDEWTVVSKRKT